MQGSMGRTEGVLGGKTPEQQLKIVKQGAKDQLNGLLRGCHGIHDSDIGFQGVDIFVEAIIGAAMLATALIQKEAIQKPSGL